jgi:general stress protein 26
MKFHKIILIVLIVSIISCNKDNNSVFPKKEFSTIEKIKMEKARQIIDSAYFATVITINNKGEAKARIMEPFRPEEDFSIMLATNPKSRKVQEIKNNSNMTIHYFEKNNPAYVTLIGKAEIINDSITKSTYFKKGWEAFYANRTSAYTLIKFSPKQLEMISIRDGYNGDKENWQPEIITFY